MKRCPGEPDGEYGELPLRQTMEAVGALEHLVKIRFISVKPMIQLYRALRFNELRNASRRLGP